MKGTLSTGTDHGVDLPDFAPRVRDDVVISIPVRVAQGCVDEAADAESRQWADTVAERLDTGRCGVALRLGPHARSADDARRLGRAVARAIRAALIRRGAPPALDIECDAPQSSVVAPGHDYRTLLPHHDGGNASYLTPSLHDAPGWNPECRRTSPPAVTTTRRHKLYQGFILQDVGDGASATTYYDLLTLIRLAHAAQTRRRDPSVPEIARWVGDNIQRAIAVMTVHGGTYLTLGGLLGAGRLSHVVVPVHHAEAPLDDDLRRRFPDLADIEDVREDEGGATERLFDRVLRETTGVGWRRIRQLVEIAIRGTSRDFILGHNLTLLHGGWRGGRGRIIEPICFVLEQANGADYERWLAAAWRRGCPGGRDDA